MRILVTGAAGDLGRHVVGRLVLAGHDVAALIRPGRQQMRAPLFPPGVERVEMDLENLDPERLPSGMEAIISLAQSSHYRQFPDKAAEIFAVNVAANQRLFEWARRRAIGRFVLASSGGVYDRHARAMTDRRSQSEAETPLSFYLGTKLCAELLFDSFGPFFQTSVILRPFFIFGPGQREDMLIPRLIDSVRSGRPIQLQGKDGLRLNPIYVEDAAAAFAAALGLNGSHALDVAGTDVLTMREIGEEIGRQVGRVPVFEHRSGLPTDYVANTDKARTRLPAAPTSFSEGLARTLAGG